MRNINYSGKKALCSICVILALWSLGAHAVTLPPDPDNAALLYYQAFLLRPEPDADTSASIDKVIRGSEPDDKLRRYLNLSDSRHTIEFAEAAAHVSKCNWGIRYSQGGMAPLPKLAHIRTLSFLLYADAQVLAADGDYRSALDRCLTLRRFARHVGDYTLINYLLSLSLDGLAHRCTRDVLGSMPPDIDILTWLREQLVIMHDNMPSFVQALKIDDEMCIQSFRTNPDKLKRLREHIAENADDENTREEILNLTDEKFIAYVQKPNVDFLNSIFRVIDSEMTYQEKYMEIERLTEVMDDEYAASNYVGERRIAERYNLKVRNEAHFNALKVAIEIYVIKAKTGQLPETFPDGLPKDPFSSQDFEYEVTSQGFVLRCREKEIDANKLWEFEFKI